MGVAEIHKADFADPKKVSLTVSSFEDDLKMKVATALLAGLPALPPGALPAVPGLAGSDGRVLAASRPPCCGAL